MIRRRSDIERAWLYVERIERAADSLMRLGDSQNAIELYATALTMRADLADDHEPIDFEREGWLSNAIERGLA